MEELDNVLAKCVRINFKKDNFVIANFKDSETGMSFTAKGNFFVSVGDEYYITGSNSNDNKYPNTFWGNSVRKNVDLAGLGKEEMIEFLSAVTTVTRANNLVEQLDDPLEAMRDGNVDLLSTVNGIGEDTAEKLVTLYSQQVDIAPAIIALKDYRLTPSSVAKIVKHFKNNVEIAIKSIDDNPYVISDIQGFGFMKADSAFLAKNGTKAGAIIDSRRVEAYIKYLFQETYQDGSTWLTINQLYAKVNKFVKGVDMKVVSEHIYNSKDYIQLKVDGQIRVTTKENAELELDTSKRLVELIKGESAIRLDDVDKVLKNVEASQGFDFNDDQNEAIREALDNNVFLLQGYSGTGKAQDNDTLIPIPSGGYKRMGDMQIGDYVFDRTGDKTKVVGVYPQGKLDNYKITLEDGRVTYSNDEHIWTTATSDNEFENMTLRDMIDSDVKYQIPTNQTVKYDNNKELSIHPYLLGVSIANKGVINLDSVNAIEDEYIVDKITDICSDYDSLPKYVRAGMILDDYKYSSVANRYHLLQGLFDKSGLIHSDKRNGVNVTYTTEHHQLALDIQEILRSLGYYSTIGEYGYFSYIVLVTDNSSKIKSLFSTPHKKNSFLINHPYSTSKLNTHDRIGIKSIEKMPEQVDMTCIKVDNEEHLYLTNDFIVTHNTTAINGILSAYKHMDLSVISTALSGRASDNIMRATNTQAKTMHSLLMFGTPMQFDENRPLPYDIIVLEELSMVDLKLFNMLLRAMKKGSKLLMLGDSKQLESISVGVMNTIVNVDAIPSYTLTKIQRQAQGSAIITHSLPMRAGMISKDVKVRSNTNKVYGENKDLEYVFLDNNAEDSMFKFTMKRFKDSIEKYGVQDTQILSATKKNGNNTTSKLNNLAQMIANPQSKLDKKLEFNIKFGDPDKHYVLRVGDRVLNSKNNKKTQSPEGETRPINNGNTGTLTNITVNEAGTYNLLIDFDGIGEVVYPANERDNSISLGYAITIHKSQGSTIKSVIVSLPFHYMLNSKQLIYTAITRASDYCCLITTPKTLRATLAKDASKREQVNLGYFINSLLKTDKTKGENK